MEDATAASALAGFSAKLNSIAAPTRQRFTYDQGMEMSRHQELAAATGVSVYFCDLHSPAAVPLPGDALRYTVSPLTGRVLLTRTVRVMFAPAPMPEKFLDVMPREMMLHPLQIRAEAEDAAFMIPAAAHFRPHYSKLEMPVSIVGGAGDKIVDVESHSARLHRDLPHSTLTVSPGAGHNRSATSRSHGCRDAPARQRRPYPGRTRRRCREPPAAECLFRPLGTRSGHSALRSACCRARRGRWPA
jgi:hypothetical protein